MYFREEEWKLVNESIIKVRYNIYFCFYYNILCCVLIYVKKNDNNSWNFY